MVFFLSKLGKDDDALAVANKGFEEALQSSDIFSQMDYEVGSLLFRFRGEIYLRKKMYAAAFEDFDRGAELKDPWCYLNRWVAYRELKQGDKAIAELSKAIELWPKFWPAWSWRGDHYRSLQEWAKAVADYTKALELNPKHRQSCEAAVAELEKSMKLRKGGDALEGFVLAMAHWRLGNWDEARKRYDQAVSWMEKNNPTSKELARYSAEAANLLASKGKATPKEQAK